ncbi:MAG: N-acetyl-gamma-glutamyl-phosphate reductase [Bifidobacteriaceae bacterium]|jgi:N-acetyl-gamma-glutamyl-phosphate reductase|nr:N-acetyl-gamma-glutamyl-phosphate reductase [Bifidobacteriaceae bacterium]
MKDIKVSIIGANGYAGGTIAGLLLKHPNVGAKNIISLIGSRSAGKHYGEFAPHLFELKDRVIDTFGLDKIAGSDVIFLALPHQKSADIINEIEKNDEFKNVLIIDISADHRLENKQDWDDYYGGEYLGCWDYGMPELLTSSDDDTQIKHREILKQSKRIAIGGCNVTAISLALQPLINADAIHLDDIVAVLANGYSGAGKSFKDHLLASEAFSNALPYATGGSHRHIPEILQNFKKIKNCDPSISFTPTLVPMSRGILATISVKPNSPNTDINKLNSLYNDFYKDEPFVHICDPFSDSPIQTMPNVKSVTGTNLISIGFTYDKRADRILVVSAIDNLVRGTAGSAIQSMNIALDIDEIAGLDLTPTYP